MHLWMSISSNRGFLQRNDIGKKYYGYRSFEKVITDVLSNNAHLGNQYCPKGLFGKKTFMTNFQDSFTGLNLLIVNDNFLEKEYRISIEFC